MSRRLAVTRDQCAWQSGDVRRTLEVVSQWASRSEYTLCSAGGLAMSDWVWGPWRSRTEEQPTRRKRGQGFSFYNKLVHGLFAGDFLIHFVRLLVGVIVHSAGESTFQVLKHVVSRCCEYWIKQTSHAFFLFCVTHSQWSLVFSCLLFCVWLENLRCQCDWLSCGVRWKTESAVLSEVGQVEFDLFFKKCMILQHIMGINDAKIAAGHIMWYVPFMECWYSFGCCSV